MRFTYLLMAAAALMVVAQAAPADAGFTVFGVETNLISPDGTNWREGTQRLDVLFQDVAFGNGIWAATSTGGIYTSSDGHQWTHRSVSSFTMMSIAFGNGAFVATDCVGMAYTSSNWQSWTQSSMGSPGASCTAQSLTYGNGLFVSSKGYTSPDGIVWLPRSGLGGNDVAFGNNLFVQVTNGGRISTSQDGITWTPYAQVTASSAALSGVSYGGGGWMAVGDQGAVLRSANGAVWTISPITSSTAAPTPGTPIRLGDVGFGNGRWVGIGSSGSGGLVFSSTDGGTTWSSQSAGVFQPGYSQLTRVAYGAGQWVIVGPRAIVWSQDGVGWVAANSFVWGGPATHAAQGPFLVGSSPRSPASWTSVDGQNWTARQFPGRDVVYGDGRWLSSTCGAGPANPCTAEPALYASTDLVNWTWVKDRDIGEPAPGAYAVGQWLTGGDGWMFTSPDAVHWTKHWTGVNDLMKAALHADGRWIVAGVGTVMESTDGVHWNLRASGGVCNYWRPCGIAYDPSAAGAKWVIAGAQIWTSADGVTWAASPTPTGSPFYGVARDNGLWVIVTDEPSGLMMSSPDAVTWTMVNSAAGHPWSITSDRIMPLECGPLHQKVGVGEPATVYGSSGREPYSWNAPASGLPGPVPGAHVSATYWVQGTYKVLGRDAEGNTAECTVEVEESPPPPADLPRPACGYAIESGPHIYDWEELDPSNGPGGLTNSLPGGGLAASVLHPTPAFEFDLCGTTYQSFWPTSMGFICMDPRNDLVNGRSYNFLPGSADRMYAPGCILGNQAASRLPNAWAPNAAVYGFHGWLADCGGCRFLEVRGTAPNRVIIYEFKNVGVSYNNPNPVQSSATTQPPWLTFEIKLFEASDCIEVHYKSVAVPGPGWTNWAKTNKWGFSFSAGFEGPDGNGWQYAYARGDVAPPFAKQKEAWRACPLRATPDVYVLNEDQAGQLDPTANDGVGGLPILITSHTLPTKGTLTGPVGGVFTYQPWPDVNGPDSFAYTITTPHGGTTTGTVDLMINAVNDAPTFEADVAPIVTSPARGAYARPGWAAKVAAGPPTAIDERDQAIDFELVSNTEPGLFAAPPTLKRTSSASATASGSAVSGDFAVLRFEPSRAPGRSTLCFRARDSGGTATATTLGLTPPSSATGIDVSAPHCGEVVLDGPPVAYFEPSSLHASPFEAITFNPCPAPPPLCTHDPDGTVVRHLWEFGDGDTSSLEGPSHLFARPGRYSVRLSVWDDRGAEATFSRTIVVGWPYGGPDEWDDGARTPPLADAGEDRTVLEGAFVQLAGQQRGGGLEATFDWRQAAGPPVTMTAADGPNAAFVAPRLASMEPVRLVFALKVRDGSLESAASHVTITVVSANNPPIAHAGARLVLGPGASGALDGSGSDDKDGDRLTYRWEQVPLPGEQVVGLEDADGPQPSFTAPSRPGLLHFRLTVSDGKASSQDTATVEVVRVLDPASPPQEAPASAPPRTSLGAAAAAGSMVPLVMAGASYLAVALIVAFTVVRRTRKASKS